MLNGSLPMLALIAFPLIAGLLCTAFAWNRYSHYKRTKRLVDFGSYAIGATGLVLSVLTLNGYIEQAHQMNARIHLTSDYSDFYFDQIANLIALCDDAKQNALQDDCAALNKMSSKIYARDSNGAAPIPTPPTLPLKTAEGLRYVSTLAATAKEANQKREQILKQQVVVDASIFTRLQMMQLAIPIISFAFGLGLARKIWDVAEP